MPELPEVETIRLQLNQTLKGLKITGIEVLKTKSFQGQAKKIIGRKVLGVDRRAKIILIELEGNYCLAIHLKLTGQLIFRMEETFGSAQGKHEGRGVEEKGNGPFAIKDLPNKFTRVIISFNNEGKLYFNDLRIFGWIKVIGIKNNKPGVKKACAELPELGKLGPEANDGKTFTLDYLKEVLRKTKKPIKLVLLDQEKLAGVGNIYANEALFLAKVRPDRPANSLDEDEIEMLRDSILLVLKEAIEHKGSSDRDEAYRQISGEKGTHQNYLQVYGRAGQKCPKCSGKIVRIKLGGRGTFYCPDCQR